MKLTIAWLIVSVFAVAIAVPVVVWFIAYWPKTGIAVGVATCIAVLLLGLLWAIGVISGAKGF